MLVRMISKKLNTYLHYLKHIEDIYPVKKLLFNFIYEYLKLHPDDYFWITDYDWFYRLEDMEKLHSLPYNPEWCYTDPVLI